ncbi:Hypothetical protein A7982_06934 [Minicystis rosea]|nr:Hypothetical protein A7982_06934 [Minicystis rosea]
MSAAPPGSVQGGSPTELDASAVGAATCAGEAEWQASVIDVLGSAGGLRGDS